MRATRGARNPNLQVAVTYVRNILIQPIILDFYSELRAFAAPFTLSLVIRHFEVARENSSRWFSSALWDCFGGRIFNMAAIVPKNNPTMHFHKHLDRSPAFSTWRQISPQKQSHNALSQPSRPFSRATSKWRTDRAHFQLLSHETFAKLNVGAIAFESISLLLPNLCLLLVIVL